MRKYQCFEYLDERFNAGYKAPVDVRRFAEEAGFKTFFFFYWGRRSGLGRIYGHARRFAEWLLLFLRIRRGSVLLLQFPYIRAGTPYRNAFLRLMRKLKKVRIITLVHDVNELRYEKYDKEKLLLDDAVSLSDVIVVHNKSMRAYFESERNVPSERLVELEMFDYFTEHERTDASGGFEKVVSIAGNLDVSKCPYLGRLNEFDGVTFHLYGKNYAFAESKSIVYHGVFDSEQIAAQLAPCGFGLVWDGTSTDTCEGLFGNYLRYNNPHKLALYIVAGLPVIVWNESACADFVRANGLGICVPSIGEAVQKINSITLSEYQAMRASCIALAEKMRQGFFIKRALDSAVRSLESLSPTP